jgi:hypothetical protein
VVDTGRIISSLDIQIQLPSVPNPWSPKKLGRVARS